ncbi:MAG TPA: NAD(P)H-quinone oxidoreductase [Cyclobacteriaceae bacterium]|nr:NAD(P)H-quinone oxidoreductase [Cyclobacteriaceae bacterium]
MKAIVITQPGGPEVLKVEERPVPSLQPGEVLIKVEAAGVNRPDIAQRKGNYPPPKWAPQDIPGLEVAGVIVEVNSTKRFRKGDQVCALLAGGGYAEFVAVAEGQCLPVPGNLSSVEAASLPETYFTVWTNVFDRCQLKNGESFLVHGGTGGIGVAAIQMTKAWGCEVYATAGTEEKVKFCESIGASKAINYRTENFKDRILEITGNRGVNVILDMIGGEYTQLNIDTLADDGRLSIINFQGGDESKIRLAKVLRKRLTITASTLRPRDVAFKTAIANNLEQWVWPEIEAGKIRAVVYKTFALTNADEAHRLIESGRHVGKVVLTI